MSHEWLGLHSPVVVEPGSVARNDDVVGLFCHVVLSRVDESVDLSLVLLLVLLPETKLIRYPQSDAET